MSPYSTTYTIVSLNESPGEWCADVHDPFVPDAVRQGELNGGSTLVERPELTGLVDESYRWIKPGDRQIKPGDRQDVPHEPVSKDFSNSAWAVIIFFFLPRGSLIFGVAKAPHHGHCEDAQY